MIHFYFIWLQEFKCTFKAFP